MMNKQPPFEHGLTIGGKYIVKLKTGMDTPWAKYNGEIGVLTSVSPVWCNPKYHEGGFYWSPVLAFKGGEDAAFDVQDLVQVRQELKTTQPPTFKEWRQSRLKHRNTDTSRPFGKRHEMREYTCNNPDCPKPGRKFFRYSGNVKSEKVYCSRGCSTHARFHAGVK
jgi:hypothetical protein